mmetsp:Transcript_14482/g.17611  ORF Transcript_14482/g.17611 Transcript_14482/m.17611 type:complete len:264 (-) Transcript_14482:249-1040(-)
MSNNIISSDTFDHIFEGWSIWLEPCPIEAEDIINEMQSLSSQCGGVKKGVSMFPPHCTLLYNLAPSSIKEREKNPVEYDGSKSSKEEIGAKMLQKCVNTFVKIMTDSTSELQHSSKPIIELIPSSFYFFPYPKEADNGRGFGCVIPLMMLKNTAELQRLHEIVAKVFPPDERHGEKGEQVSNYSTSQSNKEKEKNDDKAKGEFIPHMALVYAPECHHELLRQHTEEMKTSKPHFLRPLKAKYISLWSTEGKLKDWRLITRIKL